MLFLLLVRVRWLRQLPGARLFSDVLVGRKLSSDRLYSHPGTLRGGKFIKGQQSRGDIRIALLRMVAFALFIRTAIGLAKAEPRALSIRPD
jgi:hypothetical protein